MLSESDCGGPIRGMVRDLAAAGIITPRIALRSVRGTSALVVPQGISTGLVPCPKSRAARS
ncbi:hypothetical protein RSO01_85250 [Reyranella soli]|uniref:Uncharacterized protein n=1 Tax=Reyranella soli TaxID=1230389 RepID=A0A512NQZ0_9HYPH|nr:hypothetical protein RSO01_85250 [Reyranella soli]